MFQFLFGYQRRDRSNAESTPRRSGHWSALVRTFLVYFIPLSLGATTARAADTSGVQPRPSSVVSTAKMSVRILQSAQINAREWEAGAATNSPKNAQRHELVRIDPAGATTRLLVVEFE